MWAFFFCHKPPQLTQAPVLDKIGKTLIAAFYYERKARMEIPLKAVEDMCAELDIELLSQLPRTHLESLPEPRPDWAEAGLACTDDAEILPVCMQVYLDDWRLE